MKKTAVLNSEAIARMKNHVTAILARQHGARPKPGEGNTWDQGRYLSRVGQSTTGEWYASVAWRVNEGYDDDFGAVTCPCRCKLEGTPHRHHVLRAPDLLALDALI